MGNKMYVAIINTPGYLPDLTEIPEFDTIAEAWEYLQNELSDMYDDNNEGMFDGSEPVTSVEDDEGPYGQAWLEMDAYMHNGVTGAVTLVRPGNRLDIAFEVQEI